MICQRCRTLNAEFTDVCVECGSGMEKPLRLPSRGVPLATWRKPKISTAGPLASSTRLSPLTCPWCHQPFTLSWVRFLTSPWSRYDCPQCLAKLKLRDKGLAVGILRVGLVGLVTLPVGIGLMKFSNGDILVSGIASLLVCCAICVPCDKYLNQHFRELALLSPPPSTPSKK